MKRSPHKGSDGFVFPGPVFQVISIHAPTRGATFPDGRSGRISLISIHAPTRGATPMCKSLTQTINISIHAPTRGATKKGSGKTTLMTFQSTLPQGERRIVVFYFIVSHYFNPRSHKGSDSFKKVVNPCTCISIHAPTRGATIRQILFRITWSISIHAPTRGATNVIFRRGFFYAISIHAPTRGATAILHKIPYLFYFIFTNPFPISYFHTQPASDF